MSCHARWCMKERPLAQVVRRTISAQPDLSHQPEPSGLECQRWTPWWHSVAQIPPGFSRSASGCRELEGLESGNSADDYEERLLQLRKAEAKK